MDGLTTGRIVHYVMPAGEAQGRHRPAIIVNDWKDITPPCEGYVNLLVFIDGANDGYTTYPIWKTSVCYSETPVEGTWHWIEKA